MEEKLKWLRSKTNRSKAQTDFLLELCDNDLSKLCELEQKIKNCFVMYCPGSKEEVEVVMNMQTKSNYFKL